MPSLRRFSSADPSTGLTLGLITYLMWGFFPLYFRSLSPAGAFEVICHRAIWSLAFALALLAATRGMGKLRLLLHDRALLARLSLAGVLIIGNWTAYVYAVQTGRTIDASLAYCINPLLTVALGRIVLKERLSRLQAAALGLGGIAIVVLAAGLEHFPWLAIIMPTTFALYSLVKKKVATRVPPIAGMTIETGVVAPFLACYLIYLACGHRTSLQRLAAEGAGATHVATHAALLVGAGLITLIPLVLLAAASRTLSLTVLGLLQYLSPTLQMLIATLMFHEPVEPARWIGSAFVWAALVVLIVDGLRTYRRGTKAA